MDAYTCAQICNIEDFPYDLARVLRDGFEFQGIKRERFGANLKVVHKIFRKNHLSINKTNIRK